jgi:predicted O-methyltransferase YrrM
MTELIELHEATCRNSTYKQGLIDLINDLDNKITNMVEVGSYQGESTIIFADNINGLQELHAIDPWSNGYAPGDACSDKYPMSVVESNFDIRTKNFSVIKKHKTTSKEFVKEIADGSLDFVYIDGDHSYNSCKEDINMWLPKIKQGGIIAGHDYLEACFMGVVNAVNETFGKPDKTYNDTSWLKFL